EFMLSDVDAEFARLKDQVTIVHAPNDLPWGNRTVQIADPEGTHVALYTPITDAARRRFAGRLMADAVCRSFCFSNVPRATS
ncbi:hypothetical protein ACC719_36175, partial [Rhizobium ruizarguesonis]